VIAMLAGCHSGGREPVVERGTLLLDVSPEATRDSIATQVANAIEILQSQNLVERVVEQDRLELAFGGDRGVAVQKIQAAVRARRRGDSSLIEVDLAFPSRTAVDPVVAAKICNRLMQAFVEQRAHARMAAHDAHQTRLANQLEELERAGSAAADPLRDRLENELLALARDRAREPLDVRLVDPCRPRRR
jgi:uncharacterized protein involved in exopolysaccharide biosynthesis